MGTRAIAHARSAAGHHRRREAAPPRRACCPQGGRNAHPQHVPLRFLARRYAAGARMRCRRARSAACSIRCGRGRTTRTREPTQRSTWPAPPVAGWLSYTGASPARSSLLRVVIRGAGALPRAGAPPLSVGSLTAPATNRFATRSGKSSRYNCFVRFRTARPAVGHRRRVAEQREASRRPLINPGSCVSRSRLAFSRAKRNQPYVDCRQGSRNKVCPPATL